MGQKTRDRIRLRASALAVVLLLAAAVGAFPGTASREDPPAGKSSRPAPPASDPPTLKQAGREFLGDTGRIWSSPARIRDKAVLPIIGVAAAATFLIAADEPIRDGVQRFAARHAWVGDVSPVVTQAGGLAGFAAAGAFFGAGLVFKDERARDTGYLAASAILQSFVIDAFLKRMAGRQRPFVADGEDHWAGPAALFKSGGGGRYTSFPSGHSAAAFSLATVVAMEYRHLKWVPVVAYTLAGGVGLSRMTLDKHWASDVFIGAVVGHCVARFVVRNHERYRRVAPIVACTGRGVAISLIWNLDGTGR
jgi:membrane-associated phospholipid phosphatase